MMEKASLIEKARQACSKYKICYAAIDFDRHLIIYLDESVADLNVIVKLAQEMNCKDLFIEITRATHTCGPYCLCSSGAFPSLELHLPTCE